MKEGHVGALYLDSRTDTGVKKAGTEGLPHQKRDHADERVLNVTITRRESSAKGAGG